MIVCERPRPKLSSGPADYEVIDAIEKYSKNGNPMIELKLKVIDQFGLEGQCRNWLVSTADWVIRQFMESAKLHIPEPPQFVPGATHQPEINYSIDDTICLGCKGKCIITVKDNFPSIERFGLPKETSENSHEIVEDTLPNSFA